LDVECKIATYEDNGSSKMNGNIECTSMATSNILTNIEIMKTTDIAKNNMIIKMFEVDNNMRNDSKR